MGTFAGKPLFDPGQAAAECRRLGFPVGDWLGRANGFTCPAGTESGSGVVLMRRGDLDALDLDTPATLVLSVAGDAPLALKRLHVVNALCVTPGAPGDPNAMYAVELADVRRRLALAAGDRGFNLRVSPGGVFAAATAAGTTTPYTWAQIWGYLWALLPAADAGATPTLPGTPSGDPNGFDWFGLPAMEAIRLFLTRLGWDLVLDPVADTFTVVAVGDTQPGLAAAERRLMPRRLYDWEPIEPVYGRVPAEVRVLFPREPVTYGDSPWEAKTVAAVGGVRPGEAGTKILFDDLVANYSTGSLGNNVALVTRADSRAAEYYRVARASDTLRRVYSGLPADLKVGSEIRSLTWTDAGADGGITTRADRWPPAVDSSAWTGNRRQFPVPVTAGGCGWPAGLLAEDCLIASIVGAGGIPALMGSADGETWASGDVTLCETTGVLTYTRGGPDCGPPCLTLTVPVSGGAAVLRAWPHTCGCNYAVFSFAKRALCPSSERSAAGGPCADTVEVRIEWTRCPTPIPGCCDSPPATLYLTFGGPLAYLGGMTLAYAAAACTTTSPEYQPMGGAWFGTGTGPCGDYFACFGCVRDYFVGGFKDVYTLLFGAGTPAYPYSPPGPGVTPRSYEATLYSCSPFYATAYADYFNADCETPGIGDPLGYAVITETPL